MRDESDLALERYVVYHAQQILRCHSVKTIYIRFPSWFGLSPFVFVQLWKRLVTKGLLYNAKVYHALWALIFLKMYVYEDLLSTIVGADRKTVRKWVWYMLQKIAGLSDDVVSFQSPLFKIFHVVFSFCYFQIIWRDRLKVDTPYRCKVTVDGTDCRIQQPTTFGKKFDKRWYSHKFRSSGVRYEVAVCIATGLIVWIHGPFPCGSFPDIKIFRLGLKQQLANGEFVEADRGYRGEPLFVSVPNDYLSQEQKVAKDHARSRHEHINGRLKQFCCLSHVFRHDVTKHSDVFWSVAVVTQLSLLYGEKTIWSVNYTGKMLY
jgi:hypothetical protein